MSDGESCQPHTFLKKIALDDDELQFVRAKRCAFFIIIFFTLHFNLLELALFNGLPYSTTPHLSCVLHLTRNDLSTLHLGFINTRTYTIFLLKVHVSIA